jgi:hypothetical protein
LGADYWTAFCEQQFADVTIVFAEKQEFKTSRLLLYRLFDYFHALMSSGMKDSQSNIILVEHVTKG